MPSRQFISVAAAGAAAVALALVASQALPLAATAQGGVGTITGRVVWCPTAPLPVALGPGGLPDDPSLHTPEPAIAPDVPPTDAMPGGAPSVIRPVPRLPRAFPAGAVLVAAQGTPLSTRTDESGRFSLGGVPAGSFVTIAAGPVAAGGGAWALRPNAQVSAGQSLDVGTLYLAPNGTGCGLPIRLAVPGAAEDGGFSEAPAP